VLAALARLLILAANSRKQVQTFASDVLGLEVSIGDRPNIGLFPSLHHAVEDVRIRNRGSEVASAARRKFQLRNATQACAGSVAAPPSSKP
jgi:hypothetical protein